MDEDLKNGADGIFVAPGTRVIAAFRNVARTSEMRTQQVITANSLLCERMLNFEDRISAMERERRG